MGLNFKSKIDSNEKDTVTSQKQKGGSDAWWYIGP